MRNKTQCDHNDAPTAQTPDYKLKKELTKDVIYDRSSEKHSLENVPDVLVELHDAFSGNNCLSISVYFI